jgi:hypothetical protein
MSKEAEVKAKIAVYAKKEAKRRMTPISMYGSSENSNPKR